MHRPASLLLLLAGCSPPTGPAPEIRAWSPDLACDAGAPVPMTVSGEGFTPVPAHVLTEPVLTMPTLTLTRVGGLDGADDGGGYDALALSTGDGTLRWIDAGTLSFDASPALGLVPGTWDAAVGNPDGQADDRPAALVWAGPPELRDVAPGNVCIEAGTVPVTLTGSGFLVVDGATPMLTVGANAPVPTVASDCLPLAGGRDGEVCTTLTADVETTALALGDVAISLTNPEPAACSSMVPATLTVTLPPEITTVEPAFTCASGGTVRITGERLPADPVVTVGGAPVASVTVVDPNTLDVVLGADTPEGLVEVVVSGSDGCDAVATIEIVGNPDVYFVDPPTVYDGLSVVVTAWIADVTSEVTEVWLVDPAGARSALAFTWDPAEPDRVRALVPAGLAAGEYGFGIVEADGCGAELAGALTVTDTLTVAVEALDPPFAWAYDDTPVSVLATDPAPSGEVGFAPTPRVYVTLAGGDATASALTGVDFRSEGLLTARVSAGLVPGVYDVLVVNPDATVGLLPSGLTVTEEPAPVITSVSPPSVPNSDPIEVVISGRSFRDPAVSLTCREGGAETTVSATVTEASGTRIHAIVPAADFGQAVCLVTVTNSDGTYARYAGMSIRNPSENLFPWSVGTDMVEARRAPASVAGRTSAVARWVYAIGGDEGDATLPLDSIERAPVGVYGDLGAWELLSATLPFPLTLAGAAIIGEFVYLVGGQDGVGPLATTWRAHILDPDEVPELDAVSIDDAGGLGGGDWVWRVAALYDTADVSNPGGESLPSDPFVITLPDTGDLAVGLSWFPVDGAIGYRVYRSLAADTDGDLAWIGDTTLPSFRDEGAAADTTRTPLPEGALGEWASLPVLLDARESPCVAVAPDPIPDPEIVYLYAAGGRAPDGSALDTVEVLDVTVVRDGEHRAGAWRDAGVTLSDPRWACGAWTVDASRHSVVEADETWLYFGGGETGSRTVGTVDAGQVGAGGALVGWGEIDSMSPARSGFAVASASDFLYGFGGSNGDPSQSGVSAELGIEPLPEVRNWNSLGTSLAVARRLAGSAQESAVIFVIGGETDTEGASRSTDVTNW